MLKDRNASSVLPQSAATPSVPDGGEMFPWYHPASVQRHCRKCPSNQTPPVSWDPSAFIVLVDAANDLSILYHFRKGPRPCAAPFLLAGCAVSIELSRLLLWLVVSAMSKSGIAAFAQAKSSRIFGYPPWTLGPLLWGWWPAV